MIEYRVAHTALMNDGYSTILKEASEYFAGQRVHMLGSGFDEILAENSLFNAYVDKLNKGLTADDAVQMRQLLENVRLQIMQESSISGISPIASLSMPTVRKMWVKVALKNAIPTEPVKAPKFVISYMEPYMFGADNVKIPLPAALRDMDNTYAEKKRLDTDPLTLPVEGADLITLAGGSVAFGDTIDPKFSVTSVVITDEAATPANHTVTVNFVLDIRNNIVGEVAIPGTSDSDIIFVTVDRNTGLLNAASLKGNIKTFVVNGFLTSENNRNAMSVGFDIKTKDVTIGTGTHINAPISIEWLQDTMAMYQIDGALEVVDLMSNVHAQKLDQEILDFLDTSFVRAGTPYQGTFDCRPSASFAGAPSEWRNELRKVVDYYAIKMKNDSAFSNGIFALVGNPLDTQLIPNVDWIFNSTTDERGGVEVEYNLGAYSGAMRYIIVSSVNVPQGKLRMMFIPNSPKQMTYKYYPYTFNLEKGYLDPNRPNVPNIMVTKRHTIEELTPMACEVTILHNDGTLPS